MTELSPSNSNNLAPPQKKTCSNTTTFFSESIAWLIKSSTLQLGGSLGQRSTQLFFNSYQVWSFFFFTVTVTSDPHKQRLQRMTNSSKRYFFGGSLALQNDEKLWQKPRPSPTSRALHVYIDRLMCPKCIFMSSFLYLEKYIENETSWKHVPWTSQCSSGSCTHQASRRLASMLSISIHGPGRNANLMELQIVQFFYLDGTTEKGWPRCP